MVTQVTSLRMNEAADEIALQLQWVANAQGADAVKSVVYAGQNAAPRFGADFDKRAGGGAPGPQ